MVSRLKQMPLGKTVHGKAHAGSGFDALFGLRMVGDSMVDAGILAGDTLIFERSSARDGDIVLAAVGDDMITVKRLRTRARRVTLEPANLAFAPMTFAPSEVRVIGVLVRLLRACANVAAEHRTC